MRLRGLRKFPASLHRTKTEHELWSGRNELIEATVLVILEELYFDFWQLLFMWAIFMAIMGALASKMS